MSNPQRDGNQHSSGQKDRSRATGLRPGYHGSLEELGRSGPSFFAMPPMGSQQDGVSSAAAVRQSSETEASHARTQQEHKGCRYHRRRERNWDLRMSGVRDLEAGLAEPWDNWVRQCQRVRDHVCSHSGFALLVLIWGQRQVGKRGM